MNNRTRAEHEEHIEDIAAEYITDSDVGFVLEGSNDGSSQLR